MNHDLTQNSEKTNTSRCLSSDRKLILCQDASKSFEFLSRSSDSLNSDDDTSTCKVSGNAKSFDTKIACRGRGGPRRRAGRGPSGR